MSATWTDRANALAASLAAPLALIAAAALAWGLLSQVSFFYGFFYDALAIDRHIAEFAPQNRYRDGFEQTSRAQRLALFSGMLSAVNHGGQGLSGLTYSNGSRQMTLLRRPEIRHLQDVARLLTALRRAGWVAGGLLASYILILRARRQRPPTRPMLGGAVIAVLLPALVAAAAFDGRREGWFDQLHQWAFPSNNQWFFYYQESLMTTLLKAPDLFGPLGAEWASLTLALLAGFFTLLRGLNRRDD